VNPAVVGLLVDESVASKSKKNFNGLRIYALFGQNPSASTGRGDKMKHVPHRGRQPNRIEWGDTIRNLAFDPKRGTRAIAPLMRFRRGNRNPAVQLGKMGHGLAWKWRFNRFPRRCGPPQPRRLRLYSHSDPNPKTKNGRMGVVWPQRGGGVFIHGVRRQNSPEIDAKNLLRYVNRLCREKLFWARIPGCHLDIQRSIKPITRCCYRWLQSVQTKEERKTSSTRENIQKIVQVYKDGPNHAFPTLHLRVVAENDYIIFDALWLR